MPRTKPSRLELELIAEVDKHGYRVTATQLERWRQQLWLPRTKDWRDADGTLRPEVVHLTMGLVRASGQGRSVSWAGWYCWALADTPETAERLRDALLSSIRKPLEKAGLNVDQVPGGDSDAAFEAREELAAQLLRTVAPRAGTWTERCAHTRPRTVSSCPRATPCRTSSTGRSRNRGPACWSAGHLMWASRA
ncbi:hypothetical protein [Streptomyces sp. CB02009]|uniref:hypothetical protein n=1 Tax=Streptomyces sp. CB02009 TaxID=1703938 RepID=UPI00093CC646|nr:hypothetical protein [Streptomyces sp. CB02009]